MQHAVRCATRSGGHRSRIRPASGVAVLLDDVDALVAIDELVQLAGEGLRAQLEIAGAQAELLFELARGSSIAQWLVP